MNLGHPVLQDMIKLGCKSQMKIFLAFQTYLELCEVERAKSVDYYYCTELDMIYLVAQMDEQEVYVPLGINESLSPHKIKLFREVLSKQFDCREMYLVLRSSDTSSVTYKVSDGIEKPISPEASKEKKDIKEKRNLFEVEILNLIPSLIEQARNS